jgi:NADPH-dependent ferric siderophore reductase
VLQLRTFLSTVSAVCDIHPHLREVTIAGGDLATFEPCGPDTFLYLLLPPPGRTELTFDQSFSWEAWGAMPAAERPVGAYYTLRRWRPEQAELDLQMVRHGATGPASAWVEDVVPGAPVGLWGPRTAWDPPAGTDRYLLVADETGLPAIAVILETLPRDAVVTVVAEVADALSRQPLPELGPHATVHWLHRDGREAGTSTALVETVRELAWPDGTVYAWGGAESRAVTAVRRHVRDERGLAREQVSMVGYWRHASSPDEVDDDDE